MFDTMTLTKATGAVCGSLLVFLLGGWAAESIYSMGGGHGEGHAQGYVIDTGDAGTDEEVVDEGPDLAALFAAADADKGERIFNKCKACHQVEQGANGVGPYLYDVVGRKVDAVEGYSYSGALEKVAEVWTAENLFAFLENPASYAPGTAMGFAGLKKPEDRANVIAYLDGVDGSDNIVIEAAAEAPAEEAAPVEATEAEPTEAAAPAEATEEANAEATEEATEEEATEEEATEEAQAEPETTGDAVEPKATEMAAAENAPAEEAATEEAATEEAATEEAATEEAATEEAATEEAAAASEDESGFAAMVAAADIDAGKKTFRRCAACHAVEPGKNKVGPSLHGVVGNDIASAEGFTYSDALKGLDGDWTVDRLSAWLENPRGFAPGNRMGFPGLKDEGDRANVIGYLKSIAN